MPEMYILLYTPGDANMVYLLHFLGNTGPRLLSLFYWLCDFLLRQHWTVTAEHLQPLQTSRAPHPGTSSLPPGEAFKMPGPSLCGKAGTMEKGHSHMSPSVSSELPALTASHSFPCDSPLAQGP